MSGVVGPNEPITSCAARPYDARGSVGSSRVTTGDLYRSRLSTAGSKGNSENATSTVRHTVEGKGGFDPRSAPTAEGLKLGKDQPHDTFWTDDRIACVVRDHRGLMFWVARRFDDRRPAWMDHEDLVSDATVALVRGLSAGQYTETGRLTSWVSRVTRRAIKETIIWALRQRRDGPPPVELTVFLEETIPAQRTHISLLLLRDIRNACHVDEWTAFRDVVICGYTEKEAAAMAGCPLQTLASRVQRAKRYAQAVSS